MSSAHRPQTRAAGLLYCQTAARIWTVGSAKLNKREGGRNHNGGVTEVTNRGGGIIMNGVERVRTRGGGPVGGYGQNIRGGRDGE